MSEYPENTRRGIRRSVYFMLLLLVFVIASFVFKINQPRVLNSSELKLNGAYVFDQPRELQPFTLSNHLGANFNRDSLAGPWSLVFFGFTHCPDICPTTMAQLNQLVDSLQGTPAEDVRIIMVSVDPARDTIERMAQYVPYFNPEFLGVTGDYVETHRLATSLNTPFRKVLLDGGPDYTMDHGTNIALINPRGHYHGFFKSPHELAKLKLTLNSIVSRW